MDEHSADTLPASADTTPIGRTHPVVHWRRFADHRNLSDKVAAE